MSRWLLAAVAAAGVLTFVAPAFAAERLDAYTAVVSAKQLAILSERGCSTMARTRWPAGRRSASS